MSEHQEKARESLWEDGHDPVDLGCPVCFAPPGDACTTPDGKPRNDHAARAKLAAKGEDDDD